mmetsp:Transcript_25463/g.33249  ORF Transcript_25463/g.33249 Transcript_25463/m.33249 type:complete len:181 (+) Transcript_25463:60-602(+)
MMNPAAEAAAKAAAAPSQEIRDITNLIDKSNSYCLNEHPSYRFGNLFMGDDRLQLRSDADEQLLIHIAFTEQVKLHSISFQSPQDDPEAAPVTVKLFTNRDSLGFSDATDIAPTQELELSLTDLGADSACALKYVKFQNVVTVSIFIEDNNGSDYTALSSLKFFGVPVHTTNMSELKKVG